MTITRFVAYYRVSTARQGKSGLGLDAQRAAVCEYLRDDAGRLLAEFTEVESGTSADRLQLKAAVAACRVHRAVLVIAKLDRLARNVAFVSQLMEAGVEFVAVDFPQANRLTIHILAAVAEHEARAISERTKAALAAAKAQGRNIGGFRGRAGTPEDLAKARDARSLAARRRTADLLPVIEGYRSTGATGYSDLAHRLNEAGITAPRGGTWSAAQVRRACISEASPLQASAS